MPTITGSIRLSFVPPTSEPTLPLGIFAIRTICIANSPVTAIKTSASSLVCLVYCCPCELVGVYPRRMISRVAARKQIAHIPSEGVGCSSLKTENRLQKTGGVVGPRTGLPILVHLNTYNEQRTIIGVRESLSLSPPTNPRSSWSPRGKSFPSRPGPVFVRPG